VSTRRQAPPLRLLSFLSERAARHYAAAGRLAASAAGLRAGSLQQPGLVRLEKALGDERPALIFLCGLPYVELRDRGWPVEPLAAPVPAGGDGPLYHAALVLRPGLAALPEPCRLAYNGEDSLSGWLLPRSALPASLFANAVRSGSHRRSLELLLGAEADAAAVDSTVLALEARRDPRIDSLRVVRRVGPAPSPPAVLVHGSAEQAEALRAGLVALSRTSEGRQALALGLVDRYLPVTDADYAPVRALARGGAVPVRA
jgi:ABC-type phosphate/phosphonate transport system substrate-binding protein